MSQKTQGHEIPIPTGQILRASREEKVLRVKSHFRAHKIPSSGRQSPILNPVFQFSGLRQPPTPFSTQHEFSHQREITDHFDEFNTNLKKAESILQTEEEQHSSIYDKRDVTKGHLALTIENGILPAALPECGKQEFKLTTVAATSNTDFVNQVASQTDPTADLEITDGGRFTVQAFKDAEGAKSISSVVAALVLVLALRRGAKEISSALLQPFNRREQLICGSVCGHKAHKRFDSDMSIRRRNGQSGECPSSAFSDNPICQDEWGLPNQALRMELITLL
ncbi:hypothetical protein BLNAU_2006 [Blattamonas nauphoetae]|uniref:Uncharacterized protein n=1 Tax=Blattamonas nauphoetae TaxID=2049346 RepID=A0ABQ9YGU6_9EUKA|nr:hypothetical protein BLNAU_2006 [Blattamonas nauphoetae]